MPKSVAAKTAVTNAKALKSKAQKSEALDPTSATTPTDPTPAAVSRPSLDAEQTLQLILARLDDMKAEDTVTIDLRGKSAMFDYVVVTTGRVNRHVGAIADNVCKALKQSGCGAPHVEGLQNCDWVLIDSGDVVLHVFRPEVREFYNLERLWTQGPSPAKTL